MRRWLSGLLLAAALLGGCGRGPEDPNAPPVIDNETQYQTALTKARDLSHEHLVAYAKGETLEPEDEAELREARRQFDGLVSYMPTSFAPHIGSGKISLVLGDLDRAKKSLTQALELMPESESPEIRVVLAGARDDLANAFFLSGDMAKAEEYARQALEVDPENPNFLSTNAAILIQRGDLAKARRLLDQATESDPDNLRVRRLKKLLEAAGKEH